MFEENVLDENDDDVLSEDSLFDEDNTTSLNDEDDDEVDFDSFDDAKLEW